MELVYDKDVVFYMKKEGFYTSILKMFCRYEYDDHYFLTDPKEFIYEFFPLQPEWQLLKVYDYKKNFTLIVVG